MVSFLKLVLRVLKTVLKNPKNLIFKNRFKHLERKCFNVLGQKQSCSHEVKNDCKNLKRFSFKPLKPFCLSSEQDLIRCFSKFKKILVDFLSRSYQLYLLLILYLLLFLRIMHLVVAYRLSL